MKTWRRLLCGGIVAALLASSLASCTSAPLPTPTTAPVSANAQRDVNPVARDRVADGGLLRLPLTALPSQWNPYGPGGESAEMRRLLDPLSPAHFILDAAGRASANPDFVARADVAHGAVTTVTLHLNPKAVWGDGAPLTAADWVATWRALTGQVAGITASAPGWDAVAEVRAGDAPTDVIVVYRGVEPDWAEPLVAGPLRASAAADAASFAWSSYQASRYAGPFAVAHVDPVQGVITAERNPLWWGDRPKLERVIFRAVQAQAVSAAFQHNELDVVDLDASADALQQARGAVDTGVRTAPASAGRTLVLRQAGPLADEAVRKALLQALDRGAVAQAGLTGVTDKPAVWSNPLLLPNQPGYVDQARATGLDHDAAAAATALDAAGWVLVNGVRTRDGQALSLTFGVAASDRAARTEFTAVSAQLAAVGIRVAAVAADADLTPVTVTVAAFPLAHLPDAAASGGTIADLADRVSREVDLVRRADLASQLSRLLWQQATTVSLYQLPRTVAVRNGLANVGSPGFSTTEWEDVGWAR